MTQPLIFTDLDGTLLDHETYDFAPALPILQRLQRDQIPVILTTSKTLAELKSLKSDLSNTDPAIAENGAVIWHPDGELFDLAGPGYGEIRRIVTGLPETLRTHFIGFGDLSAAEVAEMTGLAPASAELAKLRDATEPFLWAGEPDELTALGEKLRAYDLSITQGGRFYHVVPGRDKAAALKVLADEIPNRFTLALGDGPNDSEMLKAADRGVLMPNPQGVPEKMQELLDINTIETAPAPGPAGWAEAVQAIIYG